MEKTKCPYYTFVDGGYAEELGAGTVQRTKLSDLPVCGHPAVKNRSFSLRRNFADRCEGFLTPDCDAKNYEQTD